MQETDEPITTAMRGEYRDVLRGPDGGVLADRGWQRNVIVADCRRVLAAFLKGSPGTLGIQGLLVGKGDPVWDSGVLPPPTAVVTALVDPSPHLVPAAQLTLDFLDGGVLSAAPTNRVQIVAKLGPGIPPWPDATHPAPTLREFALVATLGGASVLLNCVRHPAIVKDPSSTLDRTIWLTL